MKNRRNFRTRKEGGFFSSLFGALIGIAFVVIASPLTAWYAESQHKGEDFATATVVEADSSVEGYLVVEGEAKNNDSLLCPQRYEDIENDEDVKDCVYTEEVTEEYTVQERESCGKLSSDQVKIEYLGDECDSDGTNCEPCYLVEEYDWEEIDSETQYAEFAVGNYTVQLSDTVNKIGTREFTEYLADYSYDEYNDEYDSYYEDEYDEFYEDGYEYESDRDERGSRTQYEIGDIRYNYEYLPTDDVQLVAGDAVGDRISGAADKKPFVVSNLGYTGTLEDLESQDKTTSWLLRIVSLVLMVLGAVMIAGPLTVFTNVFRFIPFLGKRLDKGLDSMISFVAAFIGFLLWLVMYAAVLLLKNIWLVLLVFGAIGIVVVVLVQRGQKKNKDADAEGPQTSEQQTPETPKEEKPVGPKQ